MFKGFKILGFFRVLGVQVFGIRVFRLEFRVLGI